MRKKMKLLLNKTTRGTAAAMLSTLALAGTAWATFQSGNDVGAYCAKTSLPGSTAFVSCCNGGCGSIHPLSETDRTGYNSCLDKCNSYYSS